MSREQQVIVMPDNPMSVMTLFDADKAQLDSFIDYVCNTVESGTDDPLKALALSKKMEYVTKRITDRIKAEINRAADQHGDRAFKYLGTEMRYEATYTKYDFSVCGDSKLTEAYRTVQEREALLKALKEPVTVVDDESGEVVTLKPPVKTQTMGVKTTIK